MRRMPVMPAAGLGLALALALTLPACNCSVPPAVDGGSDEDAGGLGGDAGVAGVDAGVPERDAGATAVDAGVVEGDAGATDAGCTFGTATSLAAPGHLDLFGQVSYFADGGALPRGRYGVAYVDGCMKYAGSQGWTIHAYADGSIAWWLVGASTSEKVVMPPGTVGYAAGAGAFSEFAACVSANLALAPVEFDFDGGVLGVWLQDSPYQDNVSGEDGRNPVWSLSRLGGCAE